ncbi:TetR/AcrR family transcriptional regulator [Pendulispora brunnea]|uniref:TetR/AcrR family transcriptional regulator n=1 Tax=Pendulispora brunnea TaxID=2905690 RepID=A0ABZ2K3V3_9BACT
MAEKKERADPARSLLLLWGSHAKPGRSGLTVRAIVQAAIELADAKGLEAVSMRQVAEALKVGTMSLYTHVPGKGELTDLMLDTVLGEIYADEGEPARQPGGWREGMRFIARRNWEAYLRHPWMIEILGPRPALGPNLCLKYEAELRPLDGLGLTDIEMDSVLTLVLTHVSCAAAAKLSSERVQRESGMSDSEWWVTTGPILTQVMDESRFPVAGRVGSASSKAYEGLLDPMHMLTFGLERILDGVALLVEQRKQN